MGVEPRDVFEAGKGLCYDRSRVLEKIYRAAGFETRHVALYSTAETGSALAALLTPGVSSHAVTEVRTRAGWLVVDSNAAWVSTDAADRPLDMTATQASAARDARIEWREPPPTSIYIEPFTFVYGLYSRHGQFYAPYNFIPDVHYGELLHNVL